MPQQLSLLESPAPESPVWEGLNEEQRTTVIDTMARVMRKAAAAMTHVTDSPDGDAPMVAMHTRPGPQERADG